jgi:hypothetical protein
MIADVPYLLLHSPLLAAAGTWGRLPALLGPDTVVPEITADDRPPYAERYAADVAAQVGALAGRVGDPLVAVPHSGAGPLLPAVLAALRDAGRQVRAAVFLDAGLPAPGSTRLDLLAGEGATAADDLRQRLAAGARFPDWTADLLAGEVPDPDVVLAAVRPRGADFFAEPLPATPVPADLAAGYVQLSIHYASYAQRATALGWPVARADLGHLAALAAPETVARLLDEVSPAPR